MHHFKNSPKIKVRHFMNAVGLNTLLDSVRSKYQNLEQVASYLLSPKIA